MKPGSEGSMRRSGVCRCAFSVAAKFDRSTVLVPAAPGRMVVSEALVPLPDGSEPLLEPEPAVVEVVPLEPVVAVVLPGGGGGGAATSTVASDEGADRMPSDCVAPLRMASTR